MACNAHKRSTITNAVGKEVRLPTKCITNMLLALSPDDGETWVKIGAVRGTSDGTGTPIPLREKPSRADANSS